MATPRPPKVSFLLSLTPQKLILIPRCPCDECSIARLTSSLLTPDLYEEYGLKNLDGANPAQLSALDTYLQSINPPDLSSSSSSLECSYECSSDSDGVPPIFSRGDLTQSGYELSVLIDVKFASDIKNINFGFLPIHLCV